MLRKIGSLAAGAMLLSVAVSFSGGGAAAFPVEPLPSALANASGTGAFVLAQAGGDNQYQGERRIRRDGDRRLRTSWERRRDGRRCWSRSGNCRHYYRGRYYETPWWTLPIIIGGSIAARRDYDDRDYGSRHVEWCYDRYRSYNERTNTWVAYSGQVRECVSPYL